MKIRTVTAIIQPFQGGVPLHPSVTMEERISRAIELMVTFNLKCIAVTRGARPVGVIRLADAFREMGLREAKK
jgi:CBS domain-containing protein